MIEIEEYERIEDIQSFLVSEFNCEMYNFFENAKEKPWKAAFDTLEFFNFFYINLNVFLKNKNKPIELCDFFKNLEANKIIKYYFLEKFEKYIHYLSDMPEKKEDVLHLKVIWGTGLNDYHEELKSKLYKVKIRKVPAPNVSISPYNRMWRELEAQLKLLNQEDQQELLIKKKYALNQEDIDASSQQTIHHDDRKKFIEKLTLKINELNDMRKLSKSTSSKQLPQDDASLEKNDTNKKSVPSDEFVEEVKMIREEFDAFPEGYSYAFVSKQDYIIYTEILAKFFIGLDYKLPAEPIRMKHGTKTKIGSVLGEIYKKLKRGDKIVLSKDMDFHNIVRVLSYFKNIDDHKKLVRKITSSYT